LRYDLGLLQNEIARSCSTGQASVHRYLERASAAGLSWPLPEDWDDRRLNELFFPATPSGGRQPLVGYKHWFGPALNATKLCDTGVTWYTLRHTFASRLVMAGVDLRTVADLMGHATIQMTMRYAHLAPKHKLDAVERLLSTDTDTNTDTKQVSEPLGTQQVVVLQ
jgi:Phage integrase family